jgi:hypothetical protein
MLLPGPALTSCSLFAAYPVFLLAVPRALYPTNVKSVHHAAGHIMATYSQLITCLGGATPLLQSRLHCALCTRRVSFYSMILLQQYEVLLPCLSISGLACHARHWDTSLSGEKLAFLGGEIPLVLIT